MRTKAPTQKSFTDQASELVEQVTPHVEAARDRLVNDYLPVAQSMLADARDLAVEVTKDARTAAAEAAAHAEKSTRKSRRKAAKNARAKAGKMAAAAAAAAPVAAPLAERIGDKVDPKPKRGKKLLFLALLAGVGAVVMKKVRGGSSSGTSTYTPPTPAPRPTSAPAGTQTPPAPPESHFEPDPVGGAASTATLDAGPDAAAGGTTDAGGAFLDEVAADADERPHPVTTPDQPAEVEDVSDAGGSRKR